MILDMTVEPDLGAVELPPAVIHLTVYDVKKSFSVTNISLPGAKNAAQTPENPADESSDCGCGRKRKDSYPRLSRVSSSSIR